MRLLTAHARALRFGGPARHILTPASSGTTRRSSSMPGRGTSTSAAAGADGDGGGDGQQTAAPPAEASQQFRIVSEQVLHRRYLTL